MKKTIEKIAVIAHICITFIFVLLACLILFNALKIEYDAQGNAQVDSIVVVIIAVFAAVYVGLSAYLIYSAFTERNLLKEVLLYSDKGSLTKASASVIKNIAIEDAKALDGVHVKKVQIRPDEKLGFKMKVFVRVEKDNVSLALDTLRCMLEDSYVNILGLHFSAIDFRIDKMKSEYRPSVDVAEAKAKYINEKRMESKTAQQAEQQEEVSEQLTKQESSAPQQEVTQAIATVAEAPVGEKVDSIPTPSKKSSKKEKMYGEPDERPIADDIKVEIKDE